MNNRIKINGISIISYLKKLLEPLNYENRNYNIWEAGIIGIVFIFFKKKINIKLFIDKYNQKKY